MQRAEELRGKRADVFLWKRARAAELRDGRAAGQLRRAAALQQTVRAAQWRQETGLRRAQSDTQGHLERAARAMQESRELEDALARLKAVHEPESAGYTAAAAAAGKVP